MTVLSHHAHLRSRSRGIPANLVQLVLDEGMPLPENPNRLLLGTKQLAALRKEGRVPRALLDRADKCGPIVAVLRNDVVVTVFRPVRRIARRR